MKGSVYFYFGHTALTKGSFDDLRTLGIVPKEGMRLNLYDLDADDQSKPTYLCGEGVLYLEQGHWHAKVDPNTLHSVPRSDENH